MNDTPLDRDLESIVGDARLAKTVRESLERLKSGYGGAMLAEMADDLLAGRTTVRDVARSSVYSQSLMDGITRYQRWQAEATVEERQRLREEARATYRRDPGDLEDGMSATG